jgi:outer membrane protein OmpA-like peptidoglycan-associated protein
MLKPAFTVLALALLAGTAGASELASTTFVYEYGVAQKSISTQEQVMCDSCRKDKITLAPEPVPMSVRFSQAQPEPTIMVAEIPKETVVEKPVVKTPVAEKVGSIHFLLNKFTLQAKEKRALVSIAGIIKKRLGEGGKVKISGFTCDLGSKKLNDTLAVKRAKTVSAFLQKQGIALAEANGTGKCCFVSSDRKLDRRAEITIWSVQND